MSSFVCRVLGFIVVLSFAAASLAEAPATQPRRRVLTVSIDGLLLDLMRSGTPSSGWSVI